MLILMTKILTLIGSIFAFFARNFSDRSRNPHKYWTSSPLGQQRIREREAAKKPKEEN